MAIQAYRPTSSARRGMTSQDFSTITSKKPMKKLLRVKKSAVARNNSGRITTRHRGGGVKRFYRQINYKLPQGTEAQVEAIEYDPNRSSHIARIKDNKGDYHYVLAAKSMKVGKKIISSDEGKVQAGNRLTLKNIPAGTSIHAVEFQPGKGGQIARTAGSSARLVAKEGKNAHVRLPSGEIRLVSLDAMATIGVVGNEQHKNIKIGKAGRKRRMGIRPTVRGVVMAAADHPHGGGDGGRHRMARPPTTPWGQKTLGYKTRRRKSTNKLIVRSRHKGKRR